MTEQLQKKGDSAIRLLQTISKAHKGEPIEVAYSGGKDSDVILQLTREAGIPYRAIYKNTTIDPAGTIKHVQEMGVEIMQPKMTFFQMIAKKGFPTRWSRFCCEVLKEYKVLDVVIMGIRTEESAKRAARYNDVTECRHYNKKDYVEAVYPILNWTTDDVAQFIADRRIKCAPVYYDENGNFHPEMRLGCVCCPLQSTQRRIDEFKKYPKMVRAYCRAGQKYFDTHPNSNTAKLFSDVYEGFAIHLFCGKSGSISGHILNKDAMFQTDYKKALQNYFNIKL